MSRDGLIKLLKSTLESYKTSARQYIVAIPRVEQQLSRLTTGTASPEEVIARLSVYGMEIRKKCEVVTFVKTVKQS